jgi:hypothetical protein
MRHGHWRMYQQKTVPDSEAIIVTALRLALISIVVSLLVDGSPVYAEQGKHSTSKLWTIADNEVVPGARSRLFRSDKKICMNISTKALPEGAYTIWWIIFNNPQHCEFPAPVGGARCGPQDQLLNTPVNYSAVWAISGIVGPDGNGYFNACLEEKTLPAPPQDKDVDGNGLMDTQGAEIHLAVRYHCEAESGTPALLGEQITRFGGGCTKGPPDTNFGLGTDGDCPCANLQFAVHPAKKQQHGDD